MNTEPDNQANNDVQSSSEDKMQLEIPKKHRSKIGLVLRLLFLVILVLLILLVFVLIQAKIKVKSEKQAFFAQLDSVSQQLDEQSQIVNENQSAIVVLKKKTNSGQETWQLDEAKYLIQMANVSLYFQHNVPTAINLLKLADSYLRDAGDTNVIEVRKMLADDIATLSEVPKIDIPGIYLQLGALNDQVEQLPLIIELQHGAQAPLDSKEANGSHSAVVKGLIDSWNAIKKVLVIRYRKSPIDPLLTPDQRGYLNLNVHLLFAQAQLALLKHNNELFQACLNEIDKAVGQYFIQTNDATKAMLTTLKKLQKIELSPKLPDISDSLQALKKLTRLQVNQMPAETNENSVLSDVEKEGV